jgi:hypothetical protein
MAIKVGSTDISNRYLGSTSATALMVTNVAAWASTPAAPVISAVQILGSAVQGQTLTASVSYTGFPSPTLTYQWKAAGVNISGATASTYLLTATEVGKAITLTVGASNTQGTATPVTSSATSAVSSGPPTLSALTLSALTATAGAAYSGTISGKTSGSTITATSSDGTSLTVSGTTVSGTFSAAGSPTVTLTETLAGATNTPRVSTATVVVSAAATLSAPVLTWTSPQTDSTPEFTADFTTPQVGDVVTLQLASDSGFTTGVQPFTHTLDSTDVSNLSINLGITTQTNGTYYARIKQSRGGTDSAWSSTVTVTIAVVAGNPAGYTKTDSAVATGLGFGSTTQTFTGKNIGIAESGRIVSVMVAAQLNTGNARITGVSVGGVALTKRTTAPAGTNVDTAIFTGNVPTGSTANVVVTGGEFEKCFIEVGTLGGIQAAQTANTKVDLASPADDLTASAITIPTSGVGLAVMINEDSRASPTITWKNGWVASTNLTSVWEYYTAQAPAGSGAAQVTRGNFETCQMVVAAFGP